MAYSSGFHHREGTSLEDAQRAKLDLVCRKLGLEPGMRMLDIGSGWVSLTLHASERGLGDRVDGSLRHFRDLTEAGVTDGSIDAKGDRPGGDPFIETYIAPDMHMKPLAKTIGLIADAGLEIRDVQAMREHYPQTVAGWALNLEQNWGTAVALVGEENARVWRLYLAGGSLAFEESRMGVDQILAVKPSRNGVSSMPASPLDWLAP